MISSTGRLASILETASAASLWLYPSDTSAAMACPGSLCGGGGSGRAHILEVDAIHKALCHLILQFQHDALGQLGAYAGCCLKGLVVARRDRQRHPVRLHHAENGQTHLGPDTGNGGQQLKAALLLLSGKAVQADVIFGHAHHGVQGSLLPHTGQRPRHTGRALGIIAHAAAAEHHGVQAFFHDFSSQTVDHLNKTLSVNALRHCQIPPFVAARHLPPERGKSFLSGGAFTHLSVSTNKIPFGGAD